MLFVLDFFGRALSALFSCWMSYLPALRKPPWVVLVFQVLSVFCSLPCYSVPSDLPRLPQTGLKGALISNGCVFYKLQAFSGSPEERCWTQTTQSSSIFVLLLIQFLDIFAQCVSLCMYHTILADVSFFPYAVTSLFIFLMSSGNTV